MIIVTDDFLPMRSFRSGARKGNRYMSKKKKKTQLKHSQPRGGAIRQFCVIVVALTAALIVCGGTLSFRFYGEDWETGGTLGPLLTLSPSASDGTADTVSHSNEPDPVTIAPETTPPSPPETTAPVTEAPAVTTTAKTTPAETTPATEPPAAPSTETVPPDTTTAPPPAGSDDPEALESHPRPNFTPPEELIIPITRVEECSPVNDAYFSDALFIGDSRTVGLYLYSGLKSTYYAQQGLNVSSVQKNAFIANGDQKLTLSEALDANSHFTKVYLSFGINEIGWSTTQAFIDSYAALVDLVQTKLPDAYIYVQEILPMTKATAENDRYRPMGGNEKVAEYNDRLYTLCEEKGLYYIALTEIFADENGDLIAADSFDGIHLGVASSKEWVAYLKTHALP